MNLLLSLALSVSLAADAPETPPGIVIDHLPAASRQYVGSPSIATLPGGEYVASHDIFGPGSTNDRTVVFASRDRGRTWARRAEIDGQWWSTLFSHRGSLYLMGTSRENGFCVIRRSEDGGRTWTTPKDGSSGLLLGDGRYHCAPVPVVLHRGRIWRAMEDTMGPGSWGSYFHVFMMSAPEEADLLKAESWTCSSRLGRDPGWLNGAFKGWLEGNAVVTPEGGIVDMLRVDVPAGHPEKAALVQISADGEAATFDPATGFVDMPGGAKKFTVRYDPESRAYWSVASIVAAPYRDRVPGQTRNTLALVSSGDLRKWSVRSVLLSHPDPVQHGFQYVDWLFDGDDIIAVCRTAFDDGEGGAHNYHDANFLTFHRIAGFRRRARQAAAPNERYSPLPQPRSVWD